MKIRLLISTILAIVSYTTQADIASQMDNWFGNMNYTNATNSGTYQAQGARMFTPGGFTARAPITQPFNVVNVQTPRISAGCGGIDLYTGGFSFIDADQFVENLRAIGQNAQSLAFMLAIQIVSPQLSSIMDDIQSWAEKINSLNMNSCEAAMSLMGGAMESFGEQHGNCIMRRMNNFGEDWTEAKSQCQRGNQKATEQADPSGPNEATWVKGNLAWYVMMEDGFFSNDLEAAELFMNIVGTTIVKDTAAADDAPNSVSNIPAALGKDRKSQYYENILNALLYGTGNTGQPMMIRQCTPATRSNDKNACLDLTPLQVINGNWEGMVPRVQQVLTSIQNNILADNQLPQNSIELGLINSTSLPVYRYISSMTAGAKDAGGLIYTTNIQKYAEFIARDIVLSSINRLVDRIRRQAGIMDDALWESKAIKDYARQLEDVQAGIQKQIDTNVQMAAVYESMQKDIRSYEREVLSRVSTGLLKKVEFR